MATIRKVGKRWRCEVRRMGANLSENFPTRCAADAWGKTTEAEIIARARGQVVSGHTLLEALDKYAAEVSPLHRGEHWEGVRLSMFKRDISFIGRPIDRIQSGEVASWRDARLKVVSGSTVKRELGLLSQVFEYARREWKWTSANPVKDVRKPSEPPGRDRTVTPREWRALFKAVGWRPGQVPQSRTALAVACFALSVRTAMRAGELLSLRGYDKTRRIARLAMTKNGRSRDVPLSRQAMRMLGQFPTFPIPLTSADLDALFRRARGLALIEGLHFHDSRHTATTMLARKLDVMDLARVTGHSDLKMLLRYYNPSVDSLADRLR